MSLDDDPVVPCASPGCPWDTRGTMYGAARPLCDGLGGLAGCLADDVRADVELDAPARR